MRNNTARKIEKRLRAGHVPEPPVELLEKLKVGIPEHLGDAAGTAGAEPGKPSAGRPVLRLLAASVFLAVLGGIVTFRVMDTVGERPLAASLEDRGALETGRKTGATEADAPAGSGLESASSDPGSEQVAPLIEEFVIGADDVGGLTARREVSPEPARPDQVVLGLEDERAPIPSVEGMVDKERGKRDQVVVAVPVEVEEERKRVLPQNLPAPAKAELRAKSKALEGQQASAGAAAAPQAMRKVADMDEGGTRPAPVAPPSTGGTAEPNDAPYGDMFFRSYGVNPFVDTEDDRFSTFGLDVDTGSYTLARSYLQRGHLPPAEAIRVEEFLNFFDYGDAAPEKSDFALTVVGAPSPFAEGPRYELIRFGLAAREVDALGRPAADLIFVIDVSGSMEREDRLGLVRRSLEILVDELREGDRVGLVVYGSQGEVLLEPTTDRAAIRSAIGRLRPGGSTNAEEGLSLAYALARESFRPGRIHRLILCSDGVANVGSTGADSILERVASAADDGIGLTTVGFGMGNYNDVLMEQLADRGDGSYAYVDNLDEARRIFAESLTGTLLTVAGDAKVQVEFNSETVSRYRLLGYENRDVADERFRDDTVDAGEIGAGHRVTALYEVKLVEGAPRKASLATFRVRYHSTASGRVEEFSHEVGRRDLVETWTEAPVSLRLAALVAEFAEILKGTYWARQGDLDDLFRRTQSLSAELAGDVRVAELAALVGKAASLAAGETEVGVER